MRGRADVVVIGAGAAGIAAARLLQESGVRVLVLEARERIGGRVFTYRGDTPVPVEMGAEFIHGTAEELQSLLRSARLAHLDVAGDRYTPGPKQLRKLDDFWEQLDRVMGRLKGPPARDRSFQAFLDAEPGGARLARARRLARQWVEGFHAADPRVISAHSLAESGWPAGDIAERRLGRVVDGYGRVLEWLAAPLAGRIRFDAVVTRVTWSPGVVAIDAGAAGGPVRTAIEARAAVITVPIGVLKAPAGETGAIEFVPAVRQKERALSLIESGSVVRVVLRFRERFWADDYGTLSFLHTPDPDFPTWWTAYPLREPLMVGWCGGPRARQLSQLGQDALESRAITTLARQFRMSRQRLRDLVDGIWTHDWERDPFARGAYSYTAVGGSEAAAMLARPVRRTLFFAGEATDTEGATGTVDGAIASGRRAAKQVLRVIA